MPEHTSKELREFSKPALRHVELINLAQTESPNKAYELASTRWPRRQAKATRFLAMLRRDYGQRAFDSLVTSTEHARTHNTEHAQGDDNMITLDSLYPDGIRNIAFSPRAYDVDDLLVLQWGENRDETKVNFKDEVRKLNLDSKQERLLVRRIIDATLAQWVTVKVRQFAQGGTWASALLATRTHFADDKDYYKKVLAATIVYLGGCAKDPVGLWSAVIPKEERAKVKQTKEDKDRLSGLAPEKALQAVIDHALEYFTADELKSLWRQLLQMRVRETFLTSYIMEWWKGLKVEGKYLSADDSVVGDVSKQLLVRDLNVLFSADYDTIGYDHRGKYLRPITEGAFERLEHLASNCWNWCKSEEGQEFFEGILMDSLARGQAAKTSVVLARLGRYFGHRDFEVGFCKRELFEECLHRLIRGAIENAANNKNFGVASALAEYVGHHTEADELRQMARRAGQRVGFDFTFHTKVTAY